jgi:hypothetical protein
MKKTIISHFYNEEYLLPWWLKHHKKYFNHGIMIDYNSTDNSCKIIKSICPNWKIVKTKNKHFDSFVIDREVEEYEKNINGWRICLNTTEFLVVDYSILDKLSSKSDKSNKQLYLGNLVFVENTISSLNKNISLFSQIINGYPQMHDGYDTINIGNRTFRSIHNHSIRYPEQGGRHFGGPISTHALKIFYYGYLISIEEIILRKLQIQSKISEEEYHKYGHCDHPNITDRTNFLKKIINYQLPGCRDMTYEISRLVDLNKLKRNLCEKNINISFL